MLRIVVLALDGVVDSSLALTLDALATANRVSVSQGRGVRFTHRLFSPGRRRIRTGMGARFAVEPEVRIARTDAVVVPGLGLATVAEIERFFDSRASRAAVAWLRATGRRCPLVAASCSAVFLLAEAGLLASRAATTTWWLGATFRERYPDVDLDETSMLVESEGILCAGASLAQIDLMLHLIARAAGPELARDVARYLAIDRRPSQARYMLSTALAGFGEDLGEIERWIRKHHARRFPIAELAKALGMSPRTLDRRVRRATGKGASRFVQRIRLEQAAHLLETSELPFAEIAARVGYRDASTLRRLLRRDLDLNPSELRKRAQASGP